MIQSPFVVFQIGKCHLIGLNEIQTENETENNPSVKLFFDMQESRFSSVYPVQKQIGLSQSLHPLIQSVWHGHESLHFANERLQSITQSKSLPHFK